jgi:hypothetical protein
MFQNEIFKLIEDVRELKARVAKLEGAPETRERRCGRKHACVGCADCKPVKDTLKDNVKDTDEESFTYCCKDNACCVCGGTGEKFAGASTQEGAKEACAFEAGGNDNWCGKCGESYLYHPEEKVARTPRTEEEGRK